MARAKKALIPPKPPTSKMSLLTVVGACLDADIHFVLSKQKFGGIYLYFEQSSIERAIELFPELFPSGKAKHGASFTIELSGAPDKGE